MFEVKADPASLIDTTRDLSQSIEKNGEATAVDWTSEKE